MSLSAARTDLLLNKDRRGRSWQGWSKEGRKKLLERFQKQSRSQENEHEESDDSGETDQAQLHHGHVDDSEEDEELDVIVQSWKQNYTYFQQEQAKRAAMGAGKDEGDDDNEDDDDDEEDSLLQAIAEEDCDYEDDESSVVDDATIYTLATYEEEDFREFVRRQEQKQPPKSFTERFLQVLGMREDDDETVVSVGTRVTAAPTLATLPEEEEPPRTPPRDNNSNAIVIDNDSVSREGKEQREAAVMELPQDAPPIPTDYGQEVFLQEEMKLQPSHFSRKDKRRKNRGDDVSLSPSALSRTMTM